MTANGSDGKNGGHGPRRQHYVSAMLLKQWGDPDQVKDRATVIGRYDMHTRRTSTATAGDECVFEDVLGARDGGQAVPLALGSPGPLVGLVGRRQHTLGLATLA